jgi:putative ABC transport system permease protein
MRQARLLAVVLGNLRRSRNHFMLASVGIVVGIATFAFFIALGIGVRQVVLGKIFPLDQLEVVPKSLAVDVGPLRMGVGADAITDQKVAELAAIPGVETVYPKMRLTAPSVGVGGEQLFGSDLRSELVADGIEPDLVTKDIGRRYSFRDFEDPEQTAETESPRACSSDSDCAKDMYCGAPAGTTAAAQERAAAEGTLEQVCRHYVPVIASEHVIELYNGALRRAHDFPQLNPGVLLGFKFDMVIGASMVRASQKDRVIREKAMLVGFSKKAMTLGITMPIGYVKRYNVEFGSPEDAKRFHSVILMIPSKDALASVAKAVEDLGLVVADTGAEQAALLIAIFMLVFGLVSAVIVGIAAVNIMHVFFMLVYERQHEIGIMRAVGASRGDITKIILGEAGILGALSGIMGLVLAFIAGETFDWISTRWVPDFPYKPETYFAFPWWLLLAAIGFAMSFCVIGAFLPARRAARMDPARVLSGR